MQKKETDRTPTETPISRRAILKTVGAAAVLGIAGGGFTLGGLRQTHAQDIPPNSADDTLVDKLNSKTISLPGPNWKGSISVEEAILARRSRRAYNNEHITASALSQLLWCAQGITKREGKFAFRAAPSAGALYPMDVFVVLPAGVFQYRPSGHLLEQIAKGDRRKDLQKACLNQKMISAASVCFVITANYEILAPKYKDRSARYCICESGCIAENIHIQCESLKLGTVIMGAFTDSEVSACLSLPSQCRPLVVMPVGPV